jgi:hypothetical protein
MGLPSRGCAVGNWEGAPVQGKWRVRPIILLPLTGALVAVLAVGAYLASPLIIRTRAVEESPFAAAVAAAPARSDDGVAAEMPSVAQAVSTDAAPAAAPQAPRTRSGQFSDRDQIHRGSGQAILGQTPQGTTVLRFESFSVTNGPDLHVFLSRSPRPMSHDDVYDGVYVGKLKASEGAFNYELPPGADVATMQSVVVYCVPFRVIFTSAPLT